MAGPQTLSPPTPLTFAESLDLRNRIEHAIAAAMDGFIKATVIRSAPTSAGPNNVPPATPGGVPLGGPDPRAVAVETTLALARYLMRDGADFCGAKAFEAKILRLEGELAAMLTGSHTADELAARMFAP